MMAELLAWSKDLSFWKRDALRRLVVQGRVSDREIDTLALACLADADALSDSEDAPELESLEWKHLPKTTVNSVNVAIQAIGNVGNVNALADRQELRFSPIGLSVVYGDIRSTNQDQSANTGSCSTASLEPFSPRNSLPMSLNKKHQDR